VFLLALRFGWASSGSYRCYYDGDDVMSGLVIIILVIINIFLKNNYIISIHIIAMIIYARCYYDGCGQWLLASAQQFCACWQAAKWQTQWPVACGQEAAANAPLEISWLASMVHASVCPNCQHMGRVE
jgi:hypothetical protein